LKDTREAMTRSAVLPTIARPQLVAVADILAVLLAISLPWSTSATGIIALLYLIAVLPMLDAERVALVKATPAAWLPLALAVLGLVGLLWATGPMAERFAGLSPFAKLAFIPLLFIHFDRSERTQWIVKAYLVACAVLLAASMLPIVVPPLRWMWASGFYGIPVKNYISQADECLVGMLLSLHFAAAAFQSRQRVAASALVLLALAFAADILFVTTSRTALVEFPILLVLFGLWHFGWKGVAAALVAGIVIAAAAWTASPYLRQRVTNAVTEVTRYEASNADTASGERLEFWKKSVRFIVAAPIIGHGTGSIPGQFRAARVGNSGVSSLVAANPHNQTLAVSIQLGLIGAAVLWAMWIAHLQLFRPDGLLAWFGIVIVVQNIIGSLFNSLLFDFAQGWTYVVGIGVAGGAMLRKRRMQSDGLRS
jgi:hypothetical protein